jgi:hypothetical protein
MGSTSREAHSLRMRAYAIHTDGARLQAGMSSMPTESTGSSPAKGQFDRTRYRDQGQASCEIGKGLLMLAQTSDAGSAVFLVVAIMVGLAVIPT